MKIYVKQVEGVTLPEKGSEVAAGYDIIATKDPEIVGEQAGPIGDTPYWKRIDYIQYETNLFIAPDARTFHTLIHPRSSISKYNLVLANSIGLVDNDYRGMVMCRFKYMWQPEDMQLIDVSGVGSVWAVKINPEKIYKKGDRIAQLVVEPTVQVEWVITNDLTDTKRGAGGFGSTPDKKQGKPLTEVFAEEQKHFEERKGQQGKSILDAYAEAGGVSTPMSYSERMKQRE